MRVREVMTKCDIIIRPLASALEAWRILSSTGLPGVPVVNDQGKVVGIVTGEEIVNAGPEMLSEGTQVQAIMQEDIYVLREDSPVTDSWTMPANVFPVINSRGRTTGIMGRTEAAQALFKMASSMFQQIETIMDSAHNGIIAINEDGVVTMFNQAAEKITRRDKSEALGRHLSEVIIPQGLLDILKDGQYQSHYKFSVEYSSGTHTYLTNRSPIIEMGKVVGAIGVFQDISEIEFISEELSSVKQLNKELETIIESSYDGILITDRDGKIIRANRANERITGISPSALQEMNTQDLVNSGIYTKSITKAIVEKNEAVTVSEQNTAHNLLITGNPVHNQQGEIVRVVINIRDMTDLNQLKNQLEQSMALSKRYHDELAQLRRKFIEQENVVIKSTSMKEVMEISLRLAQVDSTVLLLGESGVGKEVVAKTIHKHSKRSSGPFITVNCGAIPENLLESELFGYNKGAFTGANREGKPGMFELADNGTLFLDEVGDLPLPFQVKLLRVIQEKEITRVGGVRPRSVNVRIITATNKQLEELMQQGKFREDLYFRLNVVPIKIPPLRERKDDIIPLVYYFKKHFEKAYGISKEFSPGVYKDLLNHSWPGNVREVKNVVERLLVTSPGEIVQSVEIPFDFTPQSQVKPTEAADDTREITVNGIMPLKKAQLELERQLIGTALKELGSTHKAAKALGVDQSTIVRKMNRIRGAGLN
ncbi:PAS domain S-box-containing protein [Desulfotomaculum arcticum]|uniref:HTH-type transcriptional regulatory protein TyrR n=1 Tax=Desulfotruncus arcticus DSM 17038 TaxID=1121424 RepID=A0A1I2WXB2_9FIRM|nr:sigma 54-interacting transcriptional regulator [Desulfotruncus arcticus]SFH05832.1 PAS domain S-box-containing protein [Desulfotomaculum arcticum] [Desulfotruncus arcticus DSM 17038]